jgi:hypothetical protein
MASESIGTEAVVQGTLSAAQRALSIREIVAEIIACLVAFFNKVTLIEEQPRLIRDELVRCACVNNIWFGQAMHYIWHSPTKHDRMVIPDIFDKIEPGRRQIYANLVQTGHIRLIHGFRAAQKADLALDGLTFPNLRCLKIPLWDSERVAKLFLPKINAPKLDLLLIGIRYKYDDIFYDKFPHSKHIKERFPSFLQVRLAVHKKSHQSGESHCDMI